MRTLFAVAFLSAGVAAAQVGDYREIKAPPLHQMQVPQPKRVQLPNGMVVFLMEDHELPLISGAALVHTGSLMDPPEKIGLAAAVGALLRSGGTAAKTAEQVDNVLETMASSILAQEAAREDRSVMVMSDCSRK